jgi:putative transposase
MEQCRGTHMDKKDEILVKTPPLLEIVNSPWRDFLFSDIHKSEIELFRKHERTD